MKIVFLNDGIYGYARSLSSSCGGAERQQWLLARALVANGWMVTVGVRDLLDSGTRSSIDGVEFVGIGKGQILLAWYRFLKSERPDWWYWRCAYHLWGAAVEIARLTGVRTIFAAAFDTDVQVRRALVFRPRWWPLYAWGLMRTDRIFLQHGGQLSALPRKWRAKAHIVPSIAGLISTMKPHSERRKYIAWVGMLREPKRPDLLFEIARQVPSIHFVVCGGPTTHRSSSGYGDQVAKRLQALPNVEFLGQVSPEKAQEVIQEAAILLSTSEGEGFPNTFLQAWSSGTPVVSLTIDPDRIISGNRLGAFSQSIERAVRDIANLMNSTNLRDDIALRAREYLGTTHSTEVVIKQFNNAIQGIHSWSTLGRQGTHPASLSPGREI
jgi:glycosyltransferase involved in cell wall biosynthesis